ncbi:tellurite resistance TerB family protein [Thauera sp. JM12B12]|uniref:tellurite resistance TerB family protein n=1 Tax=Thauera sp. JM12B12 TaxID=3142262 RepID=UPI0031F33FC9
MNFGNILGQILQQGMAGKGRARLDHAMGSGGIGELLGGLLGAQGGGAGSLGDLLGGALRGGRPATRGSGGLGELLGGALGGARPAAGSAGAGDALGELLGGLLGGGRARSGRTGGSAGMTILATIAMAALKNWSDNHRAQSAIAPESAGFSAPELETMTTPATEALVVRAMVAAAKADGEVGEDEVQRIVGRLGADGLSEEERQFLVAELRRPLDLRALVAEVPNQMVAAEVYAASLLAIDLDTPAEAAYLRELAGALGLDGATLSRLHQITGAIAA